LKYTSLKCKPGTCATMWQKGSNKFRSLS